MTSYKNDIIIGICEKLQLPAVKYNLAEERYHTIVDIIKKDKVFSDVELDMYPQGSFRLKTTVKPIIGEEYDLDFVVEIPNDYYMTPAQLYNHIYRILSKDGIHKNMIEKKSRCIRVNYANDFHMDIMPGQVFNKTTNEIIVPDRELKRWYHHSNPKEFANWFENKAKTRGVFSSTLKEGVEPLADQEDVAKLEPLRRAVQLVKRYRDIYCEENDREPVRSIVLCTLMGNITSSYKNEIVTLSDFCTYVNNLIDRNNGRPFDVRNPVVDEVLTEKWEEDEQNYKDFVSMINALTEDVAKLSEVSTMTDVGIKLKEMFGESITSEVIKERAEFFSSARSKGKLGVDKYGKLVILDEGTSVAEVKANTFYGEEI